jgi:AraC family transcriptional regulator of adaptative response / DNA-3-methyladenine glycosylase II
MAQARLTIAPMTLDLHTCYRALRARDARFDGRFFVAVSSTRIYCRPVCTVKPPKRENCRFYPSAAAAESAGYRPCLRCRPELAPGNASVDATTRVAQAAASLIEDRALEEGGLDAIASRLGITDRHLRRAFGAEFGVSPVEFAQTQRLLLAKRLLTDTVLPVTEVAYASGFGSLRRFNALFKQRYRLQPSALRRHTRASSQTDALSFELSFRPPYDWLAVSTFLGARSIAGVEAVEDSRYRRTVRVPAEGKDHLGWVESAFRRRSLRCGSRFRRRSRARCRRTVARQGADGSGVQSDRSVAGARHAAGEKPRPARPRRVRRFRSRDPGDLGQQVSVAAARTIAGRFALAFGDPIETPFASLQTVFPTPARIAEATSGSVARLGMPGSRARTVITLAAQSRTVRSCSRRTRTSTPRSSGCARCPA